MRQHVMIGVFLVMTPGVIAEDGINLQETEQEDQTADQFVARDVAHPVIVVIQIEVAVQTQHARLFRDLAFVAQNILPNRAGLPDVVTHVVIGGADHVASKALLDQFCHRASTKERDIIGMRLDGCQNLTLMGQTGFGPFEIRSGRRLLWASAPANPHRIEIHSRQTSQHTGIEFASTHKPLN